jgi:hypothetical protein
MTNKGHVVPSDVNLASEIGDNGGRRAEIDRRQFSYDGHIPERRHRSGRRIGLDRRGGIERRCGTDRRSQGERRNVTLKGKDERRGKV